MVRRGSVTYAYYDGTVTGADTDDNGLIGDLEKATQDTGAGATWYYSYYTSTGSRGFAHGVEYVVSPDGYQEAGVGTLGDEYNSNTSLYASSYYEYDSDARA